MESTLLFHWDVFTVGMDEEEPPGLLETTLSRRVDDLRLGMLEALKDHEPLVILASLSLVTGVFLHAFLEDAVPFAVAASAAFLAALASSLAQELMGRRPVDVYGVALGVVSIVAVALGFVMLATVVLIFAASIPLVASIAVALTEILVIVIALMASASIWDRAFRIRKADLARWSRSRASLVASGLVSTGSTALLMATFLLAPQGVTVVPGVDLGLLLLAAFIGAFAPSFYVYRVYHKVTAGTKGGRAR